MAKNTHIQKRQVVETGIVFSLVSIVLGLYLRSDSWLFVAGGLLFVTLIFPSAFRPLAYAWFGLSTVLGWLVSRIILALVFYVLVTPVGLIRRLMGKDSLQLRSFRKAQKTAFINRNHVCANQDLTYPF